MPTRYALLVTIGDGLSVLSTAPDANVGSAYSYLLRVTGGTAPYMFELLSTLPSGWSFNAGTGELSNADPDTPGTFDVTIFIRDAGWDHELTYTFSVRTVALPLTITNNPANYNAGVAQSFDYVASGGIPPYTWSYSLGPLPPGITINSAGHFSGTTVNPSGVGNSGVYMYTWQIQVEDSVGTVVPMLNSVLVTAVAISITNAMADYNAGVAQSFTYTKSGGTGAVTWDKASGTLPQNLTLSSAGVLSGTTVDPSGTGTAGTFPYDYVVRVTDAAGTIETLPEHVVVTAVAISITNSAPDGQVGVAYTHTYTSSGGTGSKTWSVASGSVPGGLSLSSAGVLSGTPTTQGTSTFTVRVTDAGGTKGDLAESVGIAYPTLTLTGTYTSTGTVGVSYSSDLTIAGGDGSYSNPRTTSGGIPTGTALTIVGSALRLSGTPTSAGSYSFTAAVDSGDGQTATSSQSLTIAATAVLIGGAFTSIGGTTRNRGCRINTDGTLNSTFNPNMDDQVFAITSLPSSKYLLGGQFFTTRSYLAKLNSDGTFDTGFNGSLGSNVNSIAVQGDGKIIIGGTFTTVLSNTRNRIARLNSDLTLDTGYNPNSNSVVGANQIVLQGDGKAIVGGSFATIGGGSRTRLARLNTDGTLDTGFADAAPDSTMRCIAIDGTGKVMVGGNFVNISGVSTRQYLARLNTDGTLDTAFNASVPANGFIFAIACLADGRYVVGGNFTTIGGGSRNYLAVLSSTGSLDTSFNANVNSLGVTCLLAQGDGYVIVGGSAFTSIGGGSRTRLARVALSDGSLDTTWNPGTCNATPNILVNA